MQPRSAKLLSDIRQSCSFIIEQSSTCTLAEYEQNLLLRSAIERHFEIIGEALIRLARSDPETVRQIADYQRIIGFRHRLAHGEEEAPTLCIAGAAWLVTRSPAQDRLVHST